MSLTSENERNPHVVPLDDARVAAVLSDEADRRIIAVCIRRAKSAKEIEHETLLPSATLYRHLARLMEAGLLVVERSALTPDGKAYDLYRSRLRSARVELDAAGYRILWEPVEDVEERLARIWYSIREK